MYVEPLRNNETHYRLDYAVGDTVNMSKSATTEIDYYSGPACAWRRSQRSNSRCGARGPSGDNRSRHDTLASTQRMTNAWTISPQFSTTTTVDFLVYSYESSFRPSTLSESSTWFASNLLEDPRPCKVHFFRVAFRLISASDKHCIIESNMRLLLLTRITSDRNYTLLDAKALHPGLTSQRRYKWEHR
uniref:Uncharacterized protein n=1 Tax=Steinernema glaseri TaxID=37863 RepID=A0A1I7ZIR7_9BILA